MTPLAARRGRLASAPNRESESSASGFGALEFEIQVSALTTGTLLARFLVQRRRHIFTALQNQPAESPPTHHTIKVQGLRASDFKAYKFRVLALTLGHAKRNSYWIVGLDVKRGLGTHNYERQACATSSSVGFASRGVGPRGLGLGVRPETVILRCKSGTLNPGPKASAPSDV